MKSHPTAFLLSAVVTLAMGAPAWAQDPLPAWKDGATKQAIVSFVHDVTEKSGAKYVAPEDRIATFDQDGTLWVEHPLYTQAVFTVDRVHELASKHPAWKTQAPFSRVLSGDPEAFGDFNGADWEELLAGTHAGLTTEQFPKIAQQWLATAKHPRFKRLYTELTYQPMQEVMRYLRENGFKTYIVTGGGQEFVRTYAEKVYGIPPEQIIGSSLLTQFEIRGGKPVLVREPKAFFVDDHGGKAVGINLFIGKRPIAAFGNSGGDKEMLQWTQAGPGARLMMLVQHDDAKREYAYGPANGLPATHFGSFPQELMDLAKKSGWHVISMKNDWKRVFSFEE